MEITLALGGGGVRGYAHIGVIRILERAGFQIKAIAGTSIGSLVGAVYLAGHSPDDMETHMAQIDQKSLYHRAADSPPSLLGVGGLTEELCTLVGGERTFDELICPFATVAVDIKTGKEIAITNGRVIDAVMASVAIPGIFPVKEIGEYTFVDGGVSNPVPVGVARKLAPNLPVVAVVLTPETQPIEHLEPPTIFDPVPVLKQIARFRVAQAFNVFARSIEISSHILTELRLEIDKPEVIIRPDLSGYGMLDDAVVSELVKLGEEAAEIALDDLHRAVSWQGRLAQRLGVYTRKQAE
ncbi:MAG: patatin-like phospholipase family protein [Anaerolineales bacterium]|nr:patatin-like phospholipase family protein [Anaerolineales bacterium]